MQADQSFACDFAFFVEFSGWILSWLCLVLPPLHPPKADGRN
jgi:hypothetical protein